MITGNGKRIGVGLGGPKQAWEYDSVEGELLPDALAISIPPGLPEGLLAIRADGTACGQR